MKRWLLCAAAIFVAVPLASSVVGAQARPNFSGAWTLDWSSIKLQPGASGPGSGPGTGAPAGGSLGENFEAKQDGATLTIDSDVPTERRLYRLDGSESRNEVVGRRGPVTIVTTAAWERDTLVLRTPGEFGLQTRTLSLVDGSLLLEIEQPFPGGSHLKAAIRYVRKK